MTMLSDIIETKYEVEHIENNMFGVHRCICVASQYIDISLRENAVNEAECNAVSKLDIPEAIAYICRKNRYTNVYLNTYQTIKTTQSVKDLQTNFTKSLKNTTMAKQAKTSTTKPTEATTRPEDYEPQPGNKAILSLADFTDENIFAELRRRGYHGELRHTRVVSV